MDTSDGKPAETLARPACSALSHRDALCNVKKAEDVSFDNPLALADVTKMATRGSPRFGALSHHSFFSRHNPHPNRVTHIQGLNGNPVCMVNDDWYVTTPLLPHPFIKSQLPRTMPGAPAIQDLYRQSSGINSANHSRALLSETWREELKDLAAKVSISAVRNDKKAGPEDRAACRKTQYSAQTGRIIPPCSQAADRRSSHSSRRAPGPRGQPPPPVLYHQELMVLELLCQILQTDSLSQVQQWLLLAGQREKDMVMDLIQKAVDSSMLNTQDQGLQDQGVTPRSCQSLLARAPLTGQHWRKHGLSR
ncbi:protein TBATA [Megalops cyprinoides]|uniref:protein TBATA n=1 Tax=Megalops cyprinoides TaxID=118141 RepID=UPI00186475E4|nr:protein TBATA [Megalops cyprinoides]